MPAVHEIYKKRTAGNLPAAGYSVFSDSNQQVQKSFMLVERPPQSTLSIVQRSSWARKRE